MAESDSRDADESLAGDVDVEERAPEGVASSADESEPEATDPTAAEDHAADPDAPGAPAAGAADDEEEESLHELVLTFFTVRVDGSAVAAYRIVFGLVAIWTALGVGMNIERYYTDDGFIPWSVVGDWVWAKWSVIALAPQVPWMPWAVFGAFLVASITLTLGLYPRTSVAIVWVVNVSLQHRNPYVLNSGDRLFMILAGLMIFLPLARRWSVHAWWRRRRGLPEPPKPSIWSVRLVQMQMAYVYWFSCFAKLNEERWLTGMALRDVLASPVYAEWPAYIDFWPLVVVMTWGTLLVEFLLPSLVWFRKYRPWVLASGVVLHVSIDVLMLVPMFSYVMIATYPLFFDDDEVERALAWLARGRRGASPGKRGAWTGRGKGSADAQREV